MNPKILTSLALLISLICGLSFCFANTGSELVDDAKNTMHNTMDAADDLGNKAENGIDNMKNSLDNDVDNLKSDTNKAFDTQSNYSVTRTSTTNDTFLGLSSVAWTWLIAAITTVGVVAIIWYYFADNTISKD